MISAISNSRRYLEILAVVVTALGKFVFMDYLNLRLPYVVTAVLGWTIYIICRSRQQKGILSYWGFRKDNFRKTIKLLLPFALGALLLFLIVGYFQDSLNLTWHILPILITYPLWGIIQQFLVIGLVSGNMHDMNEPKLNKFLIVILSAVLFSVVHYPSNWLMIGTFVLAIFYGFVYLRIRNLYALGIFHGWLAAAFYYTVVGTDPFQDAFLVWLQ
ncbi:CPBP family intramembrane metalloprotease [Aureitalea sp. L0-47]|uniref:CPBP family intramembrane glutamic endopeptidase n=1 Tax=Aureitalea sp. L0-47 TaxID=2816962 RepID=UPI002238A34A|nr:CPBP family intramembrane glutamic endopeptidase [Aureitalea sp. L0-47]MCW5520233.1 CPBP family intramembrane metalloprotease [Aureitalea sp. L0-47]